MGASSRPARPRPDSLPARHRATARPPHPSVSSSSFGHRKNALATRALKSATVILAARAWRNSKSCNKSWSFASWTTSASGEPVRAQTAQKFEHVREVKQQFLSVKSVVHRSNLHSLRPSWKCSLSAQRLAPSHLIPARLRRPMRLRPLTARPEQRCRALAGQTSSGCLLVAHLYHHRGPCRVSFSFDDSSWFPP